MSGNCAVCQSAAVQKCSGCQSVFYCSRDHQKQHWKTHKRECTPIKIANDSTLGRYLITTRDIKSGNIICTEKPLIEGPSQLTPPVCLGCYQLLTKQNARDCGACGWPVCSEECEKSPKHKPECEWTAKRGEKVHIRDFGVIHPNYQSITVLRCLYQKSSNPDKWKKIIALESHCEKRKLSPKWEIERKQVAQFIKTFFKVEDQFSEDEVMTVSGIVQVNGHEIPLSEPPYVAIYDQISMIEHNCRANCVKSFTSSGDLLLAAASAISKNDHLSICYTDPLWGTQTRQHHLAETKYFHCRCGRCQDVTELRTMFSAVKCREKECSGYLLPKSFIETDDTDQNGDKAESKPKQKEKYWYCNKCDGKVNDDIIHELIQSIGRDLSAMEKGCAESCERFITHCAKYLHPSHYYMVDVGLALSQMIGQESEMGLAGVSEDKLTLKAELCRRLANLLEELVPAEFRIRGILLFELHAAIAERGRRSSLINGPDVLIPYLLESKKVLEEAASLLKHEPIELPEGKVAVQAFKNLKDMETLVKKITLNLGDSPF